MFPSLREVMSILRAAFVIDAVVTTGFLFNLARSGSIWNKRESQLQTFPQLLFAIWAAFDLILMAGIVWPLQFADILIVQLLYKLLWIVCFAIPNYWHGERSRRFLATLFLFGLYCLLYPWVIPWRLLLRG